MQLLFAEKLSLRIDLVDQFNEEHIHNPTINAHLGDGWRGAENEMTSGNRF